MSASRMFAAMMAAVLIALCLAPAGRGHAQIEEQTLEEAHQAFLANPDMQLERPTEATPAEAPEPQRQRSDSWLRAIGEFIGGLLSALGPAFRVLFYLMIGAIVLAVLYFIFGEALRTRFGQKDQKQEKPTDDLLEEFRPDAVAARTLLEEADALARDGRYSEAVHLLLFRSIQDIQMKRGEGVPPSLTAREIGGLSGLPHKARSALSPIIAIVERSFFGGRDVDEDNWRSARSSYETFAFGESWA